MQWIGVAIDDKKVRVRFHSSVLLKIFFSSNLVLVYGLGFSLVFYPYNTGAYPYPNTGAYPYNTGAYPYPNTGAYPFNTGAHPYPSV